MAFTCSVIIVIFDLGPDGSVAIGWLVSWWMVVGCDRGVGGVVVVQLGDRAGAVLFLPRVSSLKHIFIEIDDKYLFSSAGRTVSGILGGMSTALFQGSGIWGSSEVTMRVGERTRRLSPAAQILMLRFNNTLPV